MYITFDKIHFISTFETISFCKIPTYIIIQNKWHRGGRWKFKFTLAARPLLIIP
jgi:hypothetical protein